MDFFRILLSSGSFFSRSTFSRSTRPRLCEKPDCKNYNAIFKWHGVVRATPERVFTQSESMETRRKGYTEIYNRSVASKVPTETVGTSGDSFFYFTPAIAFSSSNAALPTVCSSSHAHTSKMVRGPSGWATLQHCGWLAPM